jgi:hypothetical protein
MVEREDLRAAIEARRELGEEMEPQVIDSFVERIEDRIDERISRRLPAQRRAREGSFLLALISLGSGIPLTAIAASNSGLAAVIVVWLGIVLVNAVYNR